MRSQDMKQEQLQWIVEFTIQEGKLEQFEKIAEELANTVQNSEPGTKIYQWYLKEKENRKCVVSELYENSNAGLAHLNGKAVNTILVPKIFPIAKITRFEVYGDPSKELQEELD